MKNHRAFKLALFSICLLGIMALKVHAQTDPATDLMATLTTAWGKVATAGITVLGALIAFAMVKKFRRVT